MTDLFGRLMIDIDGFNLTNADRLILSSKHIGGLILFSRNFDSYIINFVILLKKFVQSKRI